jgi:hypothetical protein
MQAFRKCYFFTPREAAGVAVKATAVSPTFYLEWVLCFDEM